MRYYWVIFLHKQTSRHTFAETIITRQNKQYHRQDCERIELNWTGRPVKAHTQRVQYIPQWLQFWYKTACTDSANWLTLGLNFMFFPHSVAWNVTSITNLHSEYWLVFTVHVASLANRKMTHQYWLSHLCPHSWCKPNLPDGSCVDHWADLEQTNSLLEHVTHSQYCNTFPHKHGSNWKRITNYTS